LSDNNEFENQSIEEVVEDVVEEVSENNTEETTEEIIDETIEQEDVKDKKDLLIEELNDKYKRTFAEFDNFRKRSEKEKAAMFEIGAKSVIEKILPVIDNFERGFTVLTEEDMKNPFVEGMDKIYKQLMTSLEEIGVKAIETTDMEFNHDLHNAVMHIEDENFGENMIVEEFQKGYMYRETVVRHSMVKVAN